MKQAVVAALAIALATPAMAQDAPQADQAFDTDAVAQCLSSAQTDGARLDCAGAQQGACLEAVAENQPDAHPVDRELSCIEAEKQWWDARLNDRYTELMATEEARGEERAAALTRMEQGWIAFRDARCAYDRITNGHGTGGAVAEPLCILRETARQTIMLMSYLRDRT
ncbi:DUF1311 domain-containing protein [Paracoccus sp. TK19116]|uniref:DUF1311 domain-containing protein n=1 Tax=Paracoccus albicereus TaxID=2922394 RepID=A0ABT1MPS1_9RHOB|nr:lysozyme inhibitor LprI family protein [Paracoccus albicereus]MCQ0970295.1 DUF1311 domain-containing protein [Paracoccus albicereus]